MLSFENTNVGVGLLTIEPLLVLVLWIRVVLTSKVAPEFTVMDPVPTGPLDAEPIDPELDPPRKSVPAATVVPPE